VNWNVWDSPPLAGDAPTVAEVTARSLFDAGKCAAYWRGVSWLPAAPGDTVLDVGCGDGSHHAWMTGERGLVYTGCDVSATMIGLARAAHPEARFDVADATCLPYADGEFDVAFSRAMLLHLPRDVAEAAVREMVRVSQVAVVQVSALTGEPRIEQVGWCGYLVRYETEVAARRAMHKIDPTVRCVVKSAQTMMQGTREGIDAYFIFGEGA